MAIEVRDLAPQVLGAMVRQFRDASPIMSAPRPPAAAAKQSWSAWCPPEEQLAADEAATERDDSLDLLFMCCQHG